MLDTIQPANAFSHHGSLLVRKVYMQYIVLSTLDAYLGLFHRPKCPKFPEPFCSIPMVCISRPPQPVRRTSHDAGGEETVWAGIPPVYCWRVILTVAIGAYMNNDFMYVCFSFPTTTSFGPLGRSSFTGSSTLRTR